MFPGKDLFIEIHCPNLASDGFGTMDIYMIDAPIRLMQGVSTRPFLVAMYELTMYTLKNEKLFFCGG